MSPWRILYKELFVLMGLMVPKVGFSFFSIAKKTKQKMLGQGFAPSTCLASRGGDFLNNIWV